MSDNDCAPHGTSAPVLPCDAAAIDSFLSEPDPGVVECLARRPGDILVAGAGGKMGGSLCLMLARALQFSGSAHRVIAVSRFPASSGESRRLLEEHGVTIRQADLLDRSAVGSLPDAPNVFFLAGFKFGTSESPHLAWAMNTLAPAHVAERFAQSRIVAFSTGCVYTPVARESGGSTESSPTSPPGLYAHTCLGREGIFRWFSERHGTPVALVRLNYSVEFRYGVLVDIAERILAGDPVPVESGFVNVIWQRDACAHAIRCLDLCGSPAVPVNVTGPEILEVRELGRALADRLGKPVSFSGSPAPDCWLNNAELSHREFGLPHASVPEMLDWTAAWLARGGHTLGKPTHFESGSGKF